MLSALKALSRVACACALLASSASAATITYYTDSTALLGALGSQGLVVSALEEFADATLDSGVSITPAGGFDPYGNWSTAGETTFSLTSGGTSLAFGITISIFNNGPPPAITVPVTIEIGGSSLSLDGTQWYWESSATYHSYFLGFTSDTPFTAVRIGAAGHTLLTSGVGFAGPAVPEPAMGLLLSVGLASVFFARRRWK